MDKIKVTGKIPLTGEVFISGAKNAALPIFTAALLTDQEVTITNVPDLHDMRSMEQLLLQHGASLEPFGSSSLKGSINRGVRIKADKITNLVAPYDLVRKMRASVLVLGPLLARFGEAKVSLPGGCAIGTRPVNIHLSALEQMGAKIGIENGYIHATAPRGLHGAEIVFNKVSVGATENIMMAASIAEGITVLCNTAKEPEIIDLADFLNKMGAKIEGAGTDTIKITGVAKLNSVIHHLIADRIEAGTYAVAAAITGGNLSICNIDPQALGAFIYNLERTGTKVIKGKDSINVSREGNLQPLNISTSPYPGLATDLQAQMMALLSVANGTSHVTETIFENRFMHVPELNRMGAKIAVNDNLAIIEGVDQLKGAEVMATDLRASVSLVLGALSANGTSIINRVYHLDRGYEHLEEKLKACGAQIERLSA